MEQPTSENLTDRILRALRSWRRSTDDHWLGGVCGGIAYALGLPTLLVRVITVLLAFTGIGVFLYVWAWVFTPRTDGLKVLGNTTTRDVLAIGAVIVSGMVLLSQVESFDIWGSFWSMFPWLLICVGIALLIRRSERGPLDESSLDAPLPGVVVGPQPDQFAGPGDPLTGVAPYEGDNVTDVYPVVSQPAARRPRTLRALPFLTPVTIVVSLIAALVLATLRIVGVDALHPGVIGSVALLLIGAGLLASSFRGRAPMLAIFGLPLALLLGMLTMIGIRTNLSGGSASYVIDTERELAANYEAAGGELKFDLTSLELTEDRAVDIDLTVGEVELILSPSFQTRVVAEVTLGAFDIQRLSLNELRHTDPDQAVALANSKNPPKNGDWLRPTDVPNRNSQPWMSYERNGELVRNFDRTFGPTEDGPQLVINVRLALGEVSINEPKWTGALPPVVSPTQICTVGGGTIGVMKPCDEIPIAKRVAACLTSDGWTFDDYSVYDCRELGEQRGATFACQNEFGDYVSCYESKIPLIVSTPEWADAPLRIDDVAEDGDIWDDEFDHDVFHDGEFDDDDLRDGDNTIAPVEAETIAKKNGSTPTGATSDTVPVVETTIAPTTSLPAPQIDEGI